MLNIIHAQLLCYCTSVCGFIKVETRLLVKCFKNKLKNVIKKATQSKLANSEHINVSKRMIEAKLNEDI